MHPTRRLTTLAALAALILGAFAVPSAHAARGMEIALQDDPVFSSQAYFSRAKGLKLAEQLHVSRLKVNVAWIGVVGKSARSKRKPASVNYTFNQYDSLYNLAKAHNIKLQLSLTGPAPAWATGNHKIGPNKPNPKYYAEFVNATVSHFRGLIDRYSIWNEPNYVGWLAPLASGPKLYRSLYVAGYAAAKAADPAAQVLIAETSPYALRKRATAPLTFLRGVTCTDRKFANPRCGALKADGYAHHPYDFDHKPTYRYPGSTNATLSGLRNLTGALDKLAASGALTDSAGKPLDLYLTEYGFFGTGHRRTSDKKRGVYTRQAFEMAQRNPRVKEMLQYLLVAPRKPYNFFDTSIVSRRGKPTSAFKELVKWANAAIQAGKVAVPGQQAKANAPPPQSSGGGGSGGGSGGTQPPSSCPVPEVPGVGCPPVPSAPASG